MATIQDFGNIIQQIPGVKHYMLVRNDGYIVIHNTTDPDALSAMIVFCGLGGEAVKSCTGFSFFKYLMLTKHNKEKFIIFPIDAYLLGIEHSAEAYSPNLIQQVMKVIQMIRKK